MTNAKKQTAGCKAEATFINWGNFYQDCAELRDHADDVFRIALERAEEGFMNFAESFPEKSEQHIRMANIIHGIRLAGSIDEAYGRIRENGIELTPTEDRILEVFGMLDTRTEVKLLA